MEKMITLLEKVGNDKERKVKNVTARFIYTYIIRKTQRQKIEKLDQIIRVTTKRAEHRPINKEHDTNGVVRAIVTVRVHMKLIIRKLFKVHHDTRNRRTCERH